jgi:hypothetical protein
MDTARTALAPRRPKLPLIEIALVGRGADDRAGNFIRNVGNRLANALAPVPALVAVPELERFTGAGGGAGRHRRAAARAGLEDDVDLDGRVAA